MSGVTFEELATANGCGWIINVCERCAFEFGEALEKGLDGNRICGPCRHQLEVLKRPYVIIEDSKRLNALSIPKGGGET